MALGIKQQPNFLMPVGNAIPVIVDSSSSHQNNFRYQVKLYTEDSPSGYTNKSTLYLYPDVINNGYMVYDLSKLLYNYLVSNDPYIVFSTGMTFTNTEISYYVKITEYINNIIGSNYYTPTGYTFSGVVQYGETFDDNDYIPVGSGYTYDFLTIKPVRRYKRDSYSVINFFNIPPTYDTCRVVYTLYGDGYGLGFYTYDFPSDFYSYTGMTAIPLGVPQINAMATAGLLKKYGSITTSGNIITNDCSQYSVKIMNTSGYTFTDEYFVYIDDKCYRHDGVEFVYLGELGTYETIIATGANINAFKTDFNEIKSNKYSVINDNYTYNVGDRGRKIVNRRTYKQSEVNFGWVKDDQVSSILELLNSNDVYYRVDDKLYPIIITNSSYEEKSTKTSKIYSYTIKYDHSYEKLSV